MKSFRMINFIQKLTALGERQFKKETEAAHFIMLVLRERSIPFAIEKFATKIPEFLHASLIVDGRPIDAEPCCFVSGFINSKNNLISSLISSARFIDDSNINFNPSCRAISRSNHYFAPALAIAAKDIPRFSIADEIKGVVKVKPVNHQSLHILAGNRHNPKILFFAHYDSIGPGALDNASGVAVLLNLLTEKRDILKNSLCVFDGNEELSYDYPLYWGHGYRIFENRHLNLFQQAKAIYVVDCVGNDPVIIENNSATSKLSFPIKNLDKLGKKIFSVSGNIPKLMDVYHSSLDTSEKIFSKYLADAVSKLRRIG
ncbi:M28 family peptidase [Candidatus Kaiserbacteria bacterium]|nr:M28 family peptidase [Candidatus Kaiserbacteria bacterium]